MRLLNNSTRGCWLMMLLALQCCSISAVPIAALPHNVSPEKLHLKAWVPLPDGKLILLVRDTQALHMPEGTVSCTSLDGPHCIDGQKSDIYKISPWPRAGNHALSQHAQKDVKIRVLATTIKPGQTVEEAVQEELRRAEEKQSLLAESASAREGTTPEEARRALELAELESGNAIHLNLDDLDSFLDTISQMVEASGTTGDDLSRMMQMLRSATDMPMSTNDADEELGDDDVENGEDYTDDHSDDDDDDDDDDDYDEGDYNDDDYDDSDDYNDDDYDYAEDYDDEVDIGEDDPL